MTHFGPLPPVTFVFADVSRSGTRHRGFLCTNLLVPVALTSLSRHVLRRWTFWWRAYECARIFSAFSECRPTNIARVVIRGKRAGKKSEKIYESWDKKRRNLRTTERRGRGRLPAAIQSTRKMRRVTLSSQWIPRSVSYFELIGRTLERWDAISLRSVDDVFIPGWSIRQERSKRLLC